MLKLSFIVPVYNVAPYLRKCVDSLLAQDYDDYEIILVDDGSTDDSWLIIQEYVSRFRGLEDERIRGIHQENGGLSAARNTGIMAAKGEYICFVDSDDYWELNVLGGLMTQVERENLDVLRFDYQNVRLKNEGEYEVFQPYKHPHQVDERCDVQNGETYLEERMGYACYACQFVIKREIVGVFVSGIHFEDTEWMPRMMLKAKRVNSTPTIVYNYFWREGSITLTQGNKDKIKKNVEDQMRIIEKYSAFIGDYPQCHWLRNMQSSMACGVLTTVAREFYLERKVYINRLKAMGVFPLCITDQGKTYTHRAMITNLFGAEIYCRLMNFAR